MEISTQSINTVPKEIIVEIAKALISTSDNSNHKVCKYMHSLHAFAKTNKRHQTIVYGLLDGNTKHCEQFNKYIIENLAKLDPTTDKMYFAAQISTSASINLLKELLKSFDNTCVHDKIQKLETILKRRIIKAHSNSIAPVGTDYEDVDTTLGRFPEKSSALLRTQHNLWSIQLLQNDS
jgi:predicted RND superfamily exporter protein